MTEPIVIDIFSDPICPWCYIGLKRLDLALDETDSTTHMRWRCFMLNPEMPHNGMNRREYLERKFGGKEGADRVYGAIKIAAENLGIAIDFDKITHTPSTVLAHIALRESQVFDCDIEKVDIFARSLFAAYFEKGLDLGKRDQIIDIWQSSGFDPTRLERAIDEGHHKAEIFDEHRAARDRGITGVPFFIVNGTYALSGAQDKAALNRVFDLLNQKAA